MLDDDENIARSAERWVSWATSQQSPLTPATPIIPGPRSLVAEDYPERHHVYSVKPWELGIDVVDDDEGDGASPILGHNPDHGRMSRRFDGAAAYDHQPDTQGGPVFPGLAPAGHHGRRYRPGRSSSPRRNVPSVRKVLGRKPPGTWKIPTATRQAFQQRR
ncbi:hypothetical protein DL768_004429 [Monosporascus sp. mg162]|nr:hypothetical protein DL768_004429 [Monosporascus sp. mg162]